MCEWVTYHVGEQEHADPENLLVYLELDLRYGVDRSLRGPFHELLLTAYYRVSVYIHNLQLASSYLRKI